jgi:hypothetical protein
MGRKLRRRPVPSLIIAALAGQAVIAAGVLAVLAVLNGPGLSRPAAPRPAGPAPAVAPGPGEAVPAYYAALARVPATGLRAAGITIRNTMSGKVVAAVQPPAPYATFSMVAAASTASSWIVAASRQSARYQALPAASRVLGAGPTQLYLLAFNPVTRTTRIAALPGPAMPALAIWGAALSPDGSRLAVAVVPSERVHQIRVYALARAAAADGLPSGGTLQGTWTAATRMPSLFAFGDQPLGPQALSWAADDRTLAFNWQGPGLRDPGLSLGGLRVLDTRGTGGALLAGSRLAVRVPAPGFTCLGALVMTSNGQTVFCNGVKNGSTPDGHPVSAIAQFSAVTGKQARLLAPVQDKHAAIPPYACIQWASPDGSVIVAGRWQSDGRTSQLAAISAIGPGYTRPIPPAPDAGQVAW